jgi:hypothetical protein
VLRLALMLVVVGCGAPPAPAVAPRPAPAPPPIAEVSAEQRRDLTVEMSPMGVISTGTTMVWTDQAGAIWAMPVAGSAPKQLSDQKRPDFAFSLLLAGDRVFATARHGLLAVDLEAGTVSPLAVTGLPDQPEEAVADAAYLYVTIFKRNEVMRVPIGGGKAEKLATISRGVLGLHGSTLYVASYSAGTLSAIPTAGGAPRLIAKGLPRPTAVAADATHAYVYCESDRALRKIDLATGDQVMLARDLINSDDLLVDGDWIYTRSWGPRHTLLRIAKSGGAPQIIADDLRSPYRIASDTTAIYVSSRDDRRIVRIPKSTLSP